MTGIKLGIPVIRSDSPLEDFPGLKIGHFNDYAGLVITFPANTSREDFERMKAEIQAALDWAERRGEQKALAFLTGEGRRIMTCGPEVFYAGGRIVDDATIVVMNESCKAAVSAAVASFIVTRKNDVTEEPPVMRIVSAAELRGEQKAIAFLMGEGSGTPVGIAG